MGVVEVMPDACAAVQDRVINMTSLRLNPSVETLQQAG